MGEEEHAYVTPEIEKRKYRRAALVTQIQCESQGTEQIYITRDISVGGLFVKTDAPLPQSSDVQLRFQLTPTGSAITTRGRIAYGVRGLGMGVELAELTAEHREAIQKFVDEAT